ncbi:hypothetical protein FJZ36_11785 [Candidatus Poribacteria bacterium]|nr:hypothetical protein [Candidatus Poribacteria bacterium]
MKRVYWLVCAVALGVAVAVHTASAAPAPLLPGENILAAVNSNDGLGSSDMSLILQLSGDGKVWVDEGHAVKYLVPTADVPGWEKPGFNDSSWKDGLSSVGFADNDDNTAIDRGAGVVTIYTRYRFNVSDPASVKSVVLLADFDDGYIVWLNGVEIARSAQMKNAGDTPKWDYGAAGGLVVPNHEASDLAAGKPNADRWKHAAIEKTNVSFAAQAGAAVEPSGKLATAWAELKSSR